MYIAIYLNRSWAHQSESFNIMLFLSFASRPSHDSSSTWLCTVSILMLLGGTKVVMVDIISIYKDHFASWSLFFSFFPWSLLFFSLFLLCARLVNAFLLVATRWRINTSVTENTALFHSEKFNLSLYYIKILLFKCRTAMLRFLTVLSCSWCHNYTLTCSHLVGDILEFTDNSVLKKIFKLFY